MPPFLIVMRLNKYLAEAGVASRRGSDEIIRAGRVTVNGRTPDEIGVKVDPDRDQVALDGRLLRLTSETVYCILNKPRGCLTSVTDPHNRKTVMDLVRDIPQRIYPVGRLDLDSEGLLLLTNDGDLSYALTHPGYKIEKEYLVGIQGRPDDEQIRKLESGIPVEGRMTAPAKVTVLSATRRQTNLRITIHEGRKRQIRYMIKYLGYDVTELIRTRIGPIKLGDLNAAAWRYLTENEVESLKKAARIA